MPRALIGRERSAELIHGEVSRTLDSHGGLVLVAGEPGIGKTTLVTRALNDAAAKGALVVSGACWDREGAPGYWPWIQVMRGLQRELGTKEWARAADGAGAGLTFLLGEMIVPPSSEESDNAAFQLFDSVVTLLATVARDRPLIIALEDLHWADPSSLRLLDFVVHHTWFERILVVGTYRDVEVDTPGHPLRDCLRPLELRAATVTLTGLDAAAVGSVMAQITGQQPDAELAADVHRRTGGNPLFVEQLTRLAQLGGEVDTVPPGVRHAVDRHLSYVPKPILSVLADAAVIGPEFHRQVLAAVSGQPTSEIRQVLDQATVSRLVTRLDGGRFGFAHEVVRHTLYDALEPAERRAKHAAVVDALTQQPRDDITAAQLAHHAYLAVPDVSVNAATRYLIAAGREASCRLTSDESATHYARALELIPDDRPSRRAWVTYALGDQQRRIGRLDAARETFTRASVLAQRLDDAKLTAAVRDALAELTSAADDVPPRRADDDGPPPIADVAANPDAGGDRDDDAVNVFRFDGSVWTLTFAGRTAHVPDAKGLHDLHALLSRPGIDIPATDLLTATGTDDARAGRKLGGDDVLDDTAKEQYRRRLTQLDEEIDRALDRNDDQRAAEFDRERAALLAELRTAAGLGGRSRRLGDEAERSRKTVTARIRDTLRRLAQRHPELAEHLRACVSTGAACQYRPARTVAWDL